MSARPHGPAEMFARVGNQHAQSAASHRGKEQRQPNGWPTPGQRRVGPGNNPCLSRRKCLLVDCLGISTEIAKGVVPPLLSLSVGHETLKLFLAQAIELFRILSPEGSQCLVSPD